MGNKSFLPIKEPTFDNLLKEIIPAGLPIECGKTILCERDDSAYVVVNLLHRKFSEMQMSDGHIAHIKSQIEELKIAEKYTDFYEVQVFHRSFTGDHQFRIHLFNPVGLQSYINIIRKYETNKLFLKTTDLLEQFMDPVYNPLILCKQYDFGPVIGFGISMENNTTKNAVIVVNKDGVTDEQIQTVCDTAKNFES